ncbi:MAG: alcohol dehydrogenase catalytic domain-containing protein [Chloroflexi bacterium]|nr:alcohol dehydrogenase catalytic domain-containing protein [Chloroflexota bacterium]
MDTMKALIFHSPGRIAVEEVPRPHAGPGEIVIKTVAASICASDLRVYRGEKYAKPGVIPGHEFAGTVVEKGAGVEDIALGDRVTLCPVWACDRCEFCIKGKRNRCVHRLTLGYDENGGMAEYVLVSAGLVDQGHVIKLPDDVPFELASLTEPFSCTLHSMEVCQVRPGGSIFVIGAGPMGIMHLLLAQAMGLTITILSDFVDARLEHAKALGATAVVNPKRQDVTEVVMQATGGKGADAAILSVGNPDAITQCLKATRKQGFVNLFGGFPPNSATNLDPNLIHYNELFVTGTQNAPTDYYLRMVHILRTLPKAERVITHRFPLSQADKAYESRLALEGLKILVIP